MPRLSVSELLSQTGKVVVVTGASKGIGRSIARRFAEAGASVAVHYREDRAGALHGVDEAHALGSDAAAVTADVRRADDVARLFEEVAERLGEVDVLINNAGVYPLHSLTDVSEKQWAAVVETNLSGVHLCTQAVARRLIGRGAPGAVVNVASIEGLRPAFMHAHYNAAKGGVLVYTRAAALELGPSGIRVNAVSPGLIARDGIEDAWPEGVESFRQRAPLGELGSPEDVADACLFLASEGARWITGSNLVVDGGVLAATAF